MRALLDLPLGAGKRAIGERVGLHENTVRHHVCRLALVGRVRLVKRAYRKRGLVVPARVGLSEGELSWLRVGPLAVRAVAVVAHAGARRVSCSRVARELGWNVGVARYHLQSARKAGLLEAVHGAGYTLPLASDEERALAGLGPRALEAVMLVRRLGRRVSSREVMRHLGWSERTAKWNLRRAVAAGLLVVRLGRCGGYQVAGSSVPRVVPPRVLEAVALVERLGRRVTAREVTLAFDWPLPSTKGRLRRAVEAGLLRASTGRFGGYEPVLGASA
jgi:predicted transcriptional regulator